MCVNLLNTFKLERYKKYFPYLFFENNLFEYQTDAAFCYYLIINQLGLSKTR